jgi:hypothetical protein
MSTDDIVFKCSSCGCTELEEVVENIRATSIIVDMDLCKDGPQHSLCYNTQDTELDNGTLECIRCARCGRVAARGQVYDLAEKAMKALESGSNVYVY